MPDQSKFIVIGSGGQARVVVSTCRAAGHEVDAVFDDDPNRWGKTLLGIPIHGPVGDIRQRGEHPVIIGIGDAHARSALAKRLDLHWGTLIHPKAFVDPSVTLGPGTVVFAGAVVQPESTIGAHAIVNTSATVDHNCVLEDFVQVAPGANLCGNVTIREGTFVGANSVVLENLVLGKWSIVGGGAVVTRPFSDRVVMVGCPARVIKSVAMPTTSSIARESAVRKVAQVVINRVLADSGRDVREIRDEDTLTVNLELDSLDLAVTVVGLEQELGIDPFRDGAAPVQTFGQLVTLYENAARRDDAGN